jgi:hypothetical protein
MKTKTSLTINSMNRSSRHCGTVALLLIPLTLAWFGLSPAVQAVGPPDPDGFYPGFNTAEGDHALYNLDTTQGLNNTAIGFYALWQTTTGGYNTGTGSLALQANTTGGGNTATGFEALETNTTAFFNTATGYLALRSNQNGHDNTATGASALRLNIAGSYNTATGSLALYNSGGSDNTATGASALQNNDTGQDNTATGYESLLRNTNGSDNTATGAAALFNNMTGNSNTATGFSALSTNNFGSDNTAIGWQALASNSQGDDNTATGSGALGNNITGNRNTAYGDGTLSQNQRGSDNIALGYLAGLLVRNGSNNIDIGNKSAPTDANTIRIGTNGRQTRTFIAGIRDVTTGIMDCMPVVIDSAGQLGTMCSSERFKNEIKPMGGSSKAILRLRPVTFHYKSDSKGIPQFGLIAEEVAKVNPNLVVRDAKGEIYTVRYEAVNAMLLNEFLKEHRKVEALEATVAQQQKGMETLAASLKKQAAQIQAVNERLERAAPLQVVDKQ